MEIAGMIASNNLPDTKNPCLSEQASLSARQESFNSADTRYCILGKVVFPDAQDKPALLTQRFRDETIPKFVCREFLFPKCPVVHRHVGMPGASMPETAVHEYCDAFPAKNEVRLSEQ
jgi:hypothetical protein